MDDTLRTCHPAVSFAYFALVIACAMLLMHPVCLVLSTLGGGWYVARLLGGKGLRRHLLWLLPMALLAAALNPAFVHQGVTILAYLPSGNPLTLESLLWPPAPCSAPWRCGSSASPMSSPRTRWCTSLAASSRRCPCC